MGGLDRVEEQLGVLAGQQVAGVLPHHLGQVGGDHGRPVDHRGPGHRGLVAEFGRRSTWPGRPKAGSRVSTPGQPVEAVADGQELAPGRLAPRHLDAVDLIA